MQKKSIIKSAVVLALLTTLSGCGSDDSRGEESSLPELESDGQTLLFYSASANTQYAYTVDNGSVLNLQGETNSEGEDISNFNTQNTLEGQLFVWIDDKGDTDASNDESKVVMFKQDYSYTDDGNATFEDFSYLGHFHEHEDEGEMEYHLAAHSNAEFDFSDLNEEQKAVDPKYLAMVRLNKYLAEQNELEQNLTAQLPDAANGLCGFQKATNDENETSYYAMGKNGKMYKYDESLQYVSSTVITGVDSCTENEFGMSPTEDGVLYFSKATQKVYSIDAHEGGEFHVHNSWGLDEILGAGKTADMMVAIAPLVTEEE